MAEPLSVLIVEDSENDTRLLLRELERAGYAASWERVETAGSMRAALEGRSWDLVIADYTMPKFSAPAALALLQDLGLDLPFIIVSGSVGEEIAVEAMRAGAHDYLLKGNLKRLFPAIQRELEQAKQRRARRKAEERYRELFDSANDIVFTLDIEGRFTSINAAAERITGYPREQIVGRNFAEILAPDQISIAREMLRRRAAGESGAWVDTMEVLAREGKRVLLEVSTRELVEGERHVGIQGIARDITERRQLEEQLRQSQKLEAIGQLAGGVAHDFNNLLTVILGYGELLSSRADLQEEAREEIGEIRSAAERAAALTRQLLAFSRKQVLEPVVLNVNELAGNLEKMLRRLIGEDVELVTLLDPSVSKVRADPGQLEQVIVNLVVNARDAMPQGGKLTIETADVELDEAYAQRHVPTRPGHYVMVAVSDTGVGMDATVQARVFEPFFTTKGKEKGTGLGLSTVYGIVKQSDGFVWVYSEPGHGSTFKIYLPSVGEAQPAREARAAPAIAGKVSETILLVEDEELVRALSRRILEARGYRVLEAGNGAGALELLRGNTDPIHLLLTDLVMPDMSGSELASRVLALRPGLRVLYMSGYTDDAVVRGGLLEKGRAFLRKRFTPDVLARKVRGVLDREP